MATTTLIVNGSSILDNPSVTGTDTLFTHNINIHGGTPIFAPDSIVVFEVQSPTLFGEVGANSTITKITVYASGWDYVHDIATYTYTASGSPGTPFTGTTGNGDGYLRFDTGSLTAAESGAPDISQLLLTPGRDTSNLTGTLSIPRYENIDYNGNGQIDLLPYGADLLDNEGNLSLNILVNELGNGTYNDDNNLLAVICLARGTRIATPLGQRPVESLCEGDPVLTLDHGALPIRWIGSRRVCAMGRHAPVHFRAGALGNDRDLWVSPNHRMVLQGVWAQLLFGQDQVLVAAKHLVNDGSIRVEPRAEIEYFHFLFDAHQIVLAEGAATESLFPGDEALRAVDAAARNEILELFPELAGRSSIGQLSRYELTRREARAWAGYH